MDGTLHDWNRAALVIIRRALSEREGARDQHRPRRRRPSLASATSTPEMSPPHPLRRALSGFSTPRHNNNNNNSKNTGGLQGALHVGEQRVAKIFGGLRREQQQEQRHKEHDAGGLPEERLGFDDDGGGDGDQDGDQDGPHRAGSAMSEEKEEEGFVLAQSSSPKNVPEERQLTAEQLAESLLEESPDDGMADTMQLLLEMSDRLVKALRQQQKVVYLHSHASIICVQGNKIASSSVCRTLTRQELSRLLLACQHFLCYGFRSGGAVFLR